VQVSINVVARVLALEIVRALFETPPVSHLIASRPSHEGVTVGFHDGLEGIEKGRTGIWLIDMAVTSANQGERRKKG
jgi:hypothetical protein